MNNIQRNAFILDLFYDKTSVPEPVSERTPAFRNIHLSNITGNNIKKIGYIHGIEEMPVEEISFSNINMVAQEGFTVKTAKNIRFSAIDFSVEKGAALSFLDAGNILLENISSKAPLKDQPVISLENVYNTLINNSFQKEPADVFCEIKDSEVIWGRNYLLHVKTPLKETGNNRLIRNE